VNTETLIQIRGLSKKFKKNGNTSVVLDAIDLNVAAGELLLILGESGCGKTTFLNLLGDIDEADAGEIKIDGLGDVRKLGDNRRSDYRNQTIGHVFQTFNLKKNYTVYENVRVPLLFSTLTKKEAHERVLEAVEAVGLTHRIDHRPPELSEGQAQRVAIARAIVNHPKIILADEPTGNLDVKTSARITELLLHIQKTRNTTLVIVTHDPDAKAIADRVLVLEQGKFIERDTL